MRTAGVVALLTAAIVATSAHGKDASTGCSVGETQGAVAAFVDSFNRGSFGRLDTLFAQPPAFAWYSSNVPGLRRGAEARRRRPLLSYFRSRHDLGDRVRLVSAAATTSATGIGNAALRLLRSAQDFRAGSWFGLLGKVAAVCSGDGGSRRVELVVVSLGGAGSDTRR
jgi:hypothetical protein